MDIKNLKRAIAYESSKGGAMNEQNIIKNKPPKAKFNEMFKNLKWYEITAACWPIILMFVGGAIGGGLGGLACVLNLKIFNTKLPKHLKYIYSLLIGIGGIVLYAILVIILAIIFPNLFHKK